MGASTVKSAPLLLSDATIPINFRRAGEDMGQALVDYLGDRVYVIDRVWDELTRIAETDEKLAEFLKTWPPHDPIKLTPDVRLSAADAIRIRAKGGHPDEDKGEAETVFYAVKAKATGAPFLILTDDGFGKSLAKQKQLSAVDTPTLVMEMVAAGVISKKDGKRVWDTALDDPAQQAGYEPRLRKEHPHLFKTKSKKTIQREKKERKAKQNQAR